MQTPMKEWKTRVKGLTAAMLFIAALTYAHSQSEAAEVPHALTLNVSTGGFKFSGQDDLRQEPVFDLRLGYDIIGHNITDSIGIEGGVSYVSTFSNKDNTPVNAYLVRVDATYPFTPRKRLVPFLAVGAGAMVIDRATSTESSPLLAYGGGIKYFVQEFLAMRLDVRQNILFEVGSRNEFQYMFGLSFLLDRDKKIRRLPLPPPPPVERKGPAAPAVPIIDYDTPETPAPVKPPPEKAPEPEIVPGKPVTELPLPAAVIAAPIAAVSGMLSAPEQPKGEAAKAIAEPAPPEPQPAPQKPKPQPAKQKLPPVEPKPEPKQVKLPAPAPVAPPAPPAAKPVPAPASEVELIESILCPVAPPPGTRPRVLKQPSATVLFDSGSAVVKPQYLSEIGRIAAYVKKNPQSSVYIEGHTDRVGNPGLNMELSKKRVASLKKSLDEKTGGVKVKVMSAAFGCRIPVQTNKSAAGRLKNRRGTLEVTKP